MKIQLEIKSCQECPFWEEGDRRSTDDFDSGHDWFCKKKNNKKIAGFVEWHEKVEIPKWCPIAVKD